MVGRAIRAGLLCLALAAPAARAVSPEDASLAPADAALLADPRFRWQHLATAHFNLYHDQKMFATKVARLGEQFYAAIAADLPELPDRVAPDRSHIFIFRDPRDWQAIVANTPELDPWAVSFVRGQVMYLQAAGTGISGKMELLAHEMAHLVFNRFVPIRLPLWLNEGLAEYYGEFAYRDAKGMGQSRRAAFPPLKDPLPLADLLAATAYPADAATTARFYATAKYLVGFLRLKHPAASWNAFWARLLAGEDAGAALLQAYDWADLAALEKRFGQFAR